MSTCSYCGETFDLDERGCEYYRVTHDTHTHALFCSSECFAIYIQEERDGEDKDLRQLRQGSER